MRLKFKLFIVGANHIYRKNIQILDLILEKYKKQPTWVKMNLLTNFVNFK